MAVLRSILYFLIFYPGTIFYCVATLIAARFAHDCDRILASCCCATPQAIDRARACSVTRYDAEYSNVVGRTATTTTTSARSTPMSV